MLLTASFCDVTESFDDVKKHAFNNIFSLLLLPPECLCTNDLVNLMMFIIQNANIKTYTMYVPEYAVTYEDIIIYWK